ncbi:aspartyl aminopeptidase, partial [Phenoliferia sp. Uapishka_3]
MSAPPAPALRFLDFVNDSPTPFHAVHESVVRLEKAGFSRLHERDSWTSKLALGGKYFITRNQSSIIAFTVPEKLEASKPVGMSIVGCHTDSPRFIIKPVSNREKGGFAEVGVETYGGGIWATWLDRDLSIAGRVVLSGAAGAKEGEYSSHLLLHRDPILRIPTVAIHLDRNQNESMHYNPETQQIPILALASSALNATGTASPAAKVSFADPLSITTHHHPILLHTIARSLSSVMGEEIIPSQIHDFELSLFDTQLSTIGGALNEFIFSPRLDNLFSSFAAVEGLIAASRATSASDGRISMIALWDNEEVGSVSAYGAQSNFIESTIERVAVAMKKEDESTTEAYQRSLAASFLLSCDMGHSVHPSFMDKHEENHRPLMNSGPAIKTNAKQRYASTSQTTFALRRIAKIAGVPLQEYEVRNDMACGSTIGPLVSRIGLRTVDIGCPQLSMHSIRETAGSKDIGYLIVRYLPSRLRKVSDKLLTGFATCYQDLFETFFEKFGTVDNLEVD